MKYKIQSALKALKVKKWKSTYAVYHTAFTVEVYVGGEYFGLWDVVKSTFVE